MSFLTLLIILSLAIIVPLFFIIKEKSKARALHQQPNYQELHYDKQSINENNTTKLNEELSLHHLPIEYLPSFFQDVLLKIETQCHYLNNKEVPKQQWFTVKKLVDTRLPELLHDYLSLDPEYAKTDIIDKHHQLTTQDVVYAQLKSTLQFLKTINQQSDKIAVNNILASRNYLQFIYDENGVNADFIAAKTPPTTKELLSDAHSDEYVQYGYQYLGGFYTGIPDAISQQIVYALGRLVYLSDNTILLVNQKVGSHIRLDYFDMIVCQSLPILIDSLNNINTSQIRLLRAKQSRLLQKIDSITTLLLQALHILKISSEKTNISQQLTQINKKAEALTKSQFFTLDT